MGNNLILVADDDRKNLAMIKAFLTSGSFDVDLARNGEEALEKNHFPGKICCGKYGS